MTKKVKGIVNRLCGSCYMDYDSPGKEAEPNPVRYISGTW